jgi:uroporphyrinogen-III synthase
MSDAGGHDGGSAPKPPAKGFGGRAVVTFESRRAAEMASLVVRHHGAPIPAPTLREVPLTENAEAIAFARALAAGEIDGVVLMTGTGTRALVEEIASVLDRVAFAAALARVPLVVARGPKPALVLRELGVPRFVTVPEPNTWREVARAVADRAPLAGRRIAVQEHGAPSTELYEELRRGGAVVTPVPVYRWALPEDTAPLRAALHAIVAGRAHIALFTSRAQVEHVFAVAAEEQIAEPLRRALSGGMVASIGPVCTEALRAEGLEPDLEPEHSKMGHLVKAAAERSLAILEAKAR